MGSLGWFGYVVGGMVVRMVTHVLAELLDLGDHPRRHARTLSNGELGRVA